MDLNYASFFKGKTITILGGTGSIGSKILERILKYPIKEIRIISRDEYKQYKLKLKYPTEKRIKFILGDIRDLEHLTRITKGSDIIYHSAALKHVPISEEMPEEFIKTNVLGSLNVQKASLENNIPLVVSISSDKAVNPCNVMGFTKAIQEKIFSSQALKKDISGQKFINVRFGNVIGTHGSLFPVLYFQIKNNLPITITDPEMTRFFMTAEEAVELILFASTNGNNGDVIIKEMKSVKIGGLVNKFISLVSDKAKYPINTIGMRVGEKMHEELLREDEIYKIKRIDGYFLISPYTNKEITENLILKKKHRKELSAKLRSDSESNFWSDKELEKNIQEYLKTANKEIIE